MESLFKFAVISDLHYYSEKLGTTGKAYELKNLTDQKCLAESGAIIDSAFKKIAETDCNSVIIAGDLTNNGEKASHIEIKEKIARLNKAKPVYTIFATHDWCSNDKNCRYDGDRIINDVEVFTVEDNREFYREFGLNNATDTYTTEIGAVSYIVKPARNITLICINDDTNGKNCAGYTDRHFEWICNSVKKAKKHGDTVILTEHHLLTDSISPFLNKAQLIGDYRERAEKLADLGVDLVIVGHSHMQRVSKYISKKGNVLTLLNQGALCGYYAPISYVTVKNGQIEIETDHLEKFEYNGREYTKEFLKKQTVEVLTCFLDYACNDRAKFLDYSRSIGLRINHPILYPPIKLIAKLITTLNIGTIGKIINIFTFGRGLNKNTLCKMKKIRLIDYATDIFLCLFDLPEDKESDYFDIFTECASIPVKIMKKLHLTFGFIYKFFLQIEYTAKRVVGLEYEK